MKIENGRAAGTCGRREPRHGAWSTVGALVLLLGCLPGLLSAEPARNVILLIGDGMGFEQIKAGRCSKGSKLVFETWPHRGQVKTRSANSAVTDSAAAATAMATGHKVNNGVISVARPGDGSDCETVLEHFKKAGKRTGLVTTTWVTHATPACFGAHADARASYDDIGADYISRSRPNVLFGGGGHGMSAASAIAASYTVVANRDELLALDAASATLVSGQFGNGHLPYAREASGHLPSLAEMTQVALDILDHGTNGFFLMVEGGRIDHACHANDIGNCVGDMLAFDDMVKRVADWAAKRTDTLVMLTADHETGGMKVVADNGAGADPGVTWSTKGHSGTEVGIYAFGPGAEAVSGTIDNTDIYRAMMRALSASAAPR